MATIAPTSTDPALIAGNRKSAAQQAESASYAKATTATDESSDDTSTQDSINISTRAENIQKLNEEFFTGNPLDFRITQDFILRLEEFGLITADDAGRLAARSTPSDSANGSAVSEVSNFIDSYSASVKEIDPNHSLVGVLQDAKTVLDNFNNPTKSSLNINIPQVTEKLQNYVDAAKENMSEPDLQDFEQLILVLDIAHVLTPGTNTTSQIDSYLEINKLN